MCGCHEPSLTTRMNQSQATAIGSMRWPSTRTQRRSSADLLTRLLRCGQIIQAATRIRRRSQATSLLSARWPSTRTPRHVVFLAVPPYHLWLIHQFPRRSSSLRYQCSRSSSYIVIVDPMSKCAQQVKLACIQSFSTTAREAGPRCIARCQELHPARSRVARPAGPHSTSPCGS